MFYAKRLSAPRKLHQQHVLPRHGSRSMYEAKMNFKLNW
jgi:hypothetical protein